MDVQTVLDRSELMKRMRLWFSDQGYLEVSTPVLSPDLIPEPTIKNFSTWYMSEFLGQRELYLVPSPEVFMKRIIADLKMSIFQFSPCFRNAEQAGAYHNPEFTMLEYYTMHADDEASIGITEKLFLDTALPRCPDHLLPPFRRMTVAQACHDYAGIDLDRLQDTPNLRSKAASLGLSLPPAGEAESWETTFNRIFLHCVEPALPQDKPLVLEQYPYQIDCLAEKIPGRPYRRRWELYAGGIELANCYKEETNRDRIASYYQEQYALLASERAHTGEVIPDMDPLFPSLFGPEYPACSGVAIGFDRLLMLQTGRSTLGGVILFPLSVMLTGG